MLSKPAGCTGCPLEHIGIGFVPTKLGPSGTLVLGDTPHQDDVDEEAPFMGRSGQFLTNLLAKSGTQRKDITTANVICCRPPNGLYPLDPKWHLTSRSDARMAVTHCTRAYLQPLLASKDWRRVVAVGEWALGAVTERKGILVWRGSPLPLRGTVDRARVMPTLHPSDLVRDFKFTSAVVSDLRKGLDLPPENYDLFADAARLSLFKSLKLAFDFEWTWNGDITIAGISDRLYSAVVGAWNGANIDQFKRIFESATDLIGHNIIGADTKQFEKFGWQIKAKLHDTMLKQHLIQPDFKHDLGFVASVFTNKVFWKGHGKEEEDEYGNSIDTKVQWKTWNTPEAIPRHLGGYGGCASADEAYRLYNARDTDASFQINEQLDHLLAKWGLENTYWNISVPVSFVCRDMSDRGLKISPQRIQELRSELGVKISGLESSLPDGLKPIEIPCTRQIVAPPGTFKSRTKLCKGLRKAPHVPVEITFHSPGSEFQCPSCGKQIPSGKLALLKRIKVPGIKLKRPWKSSTQVMAYAKTRGLKMRIDRKRGTASADVNTRKVWGRVAPEFQIVDKLKEYSTLRDNFAKESLQHLDRMYFNLLVHGTKEGRFASSGKRKGIDLNIQNQPAEFRKIYLPEHEDWCFAELDYSGGENWLTAWLAQDTERLQRLGQPGYSEHLELAKMIFGLPAAATKEDAQSWKGMDAYDIAKHINHGSNYGMTHVKFREYCESEDVFFTEKECKEILAVREKMNPGTARWQRATIESAKRDGYLRNAFGRMRWFCMPPETKTLTSNLLWKNLGDIRKGDELIGFDEEISHQPKYQPTIVESAEIIKAPLYEITTSRGVFRATPEHGWVTRIPIGHNGAEYGRYIHRWITTKFLSKGDQIVWFGDPWKEETSRDAAWLSGLLDGEGTVCTASRGDTRFAQNDGIVLERAIQVAQSLGFKTSPPRQNGRGITNKEVRLLTGAPHQALEVIGRLQPIRLVKNARKVWDNKPMWGKSAYHEVAIVESIKFVGEGEVVAIGTSTRTLLTDGLCSHNSTRSIATEALAFLPASSLADIIIRAMVGHYPSRFPENCAALGLVATGELMPSWLLSIQVHDSLVLQGPVQYATQQISRTAAIMTQPWAELQGFKLDVEAKAGAAGAAWGELRKVKI